MKPTPKKLTKSMRADIDAALKIYPKLCWEFRLLDDHLSVLGSSSNPGDGDLVKTSPSGIGPQDRVIDLKERHWEHRMLLSVISGIERGKESLTDRQREFIEVVYEGPEKPPVEESAARLGFVGVARVTKFYELQRRVFSQLAPYVLAPFRRYAYQECLGRFGFYKKNGY